jgi:hypothetical protein
MIMDSWTTSPGHLNPPHRPQHIDQTRHHALVRRDLRCKRWCLHQFPDLLYSTSYLNKRLSNSRKDVG